MGIAAYNRGSDALKQFTFGSLFAGIGGLDLGLERAGMTCKWQVEINPFCQRVLEKHWPGVKRYGDITKVDGRELQPVNLIAGGFPCTDISDAGKRDGIHGAHSKLWFEMLRVICMVRPNFVLVENVAALLDRGLCTVLAGLAESGFDAEWDCIPASALGAHHQRDRTFIVAYPQGRTKFYGIFRKGNIYSNGQTPLWPGFDCVMPRMADGISYRVDRRRALGNAVVPQVAEWIGQCILSMGVEIPQTTKGEPDEGDNLFSTLKSE